MTALVFDTHAFVKKLKEAGFSESQAEAQADALIKALTQFREEVHLDELATKPDLRELELRLEAKLAETKAEIIRWTIGAGIFQTALIAALLLKLVH